MKRINEIKFALNEPFNPSEVLKKVAHKTKINPKDIKDINIIKESIDARKGVVFSYTVDFKVLNEQKYQHLNLKDAPEAVIPIHNQLNKTEKEQLEKSEAPLIIGFGPAGMFAALQMVQAGLKPIVFEMGEAVDDRDKSVERFWKDGILNEKSNVQFGEGGAGTYSDGKLTTRIKDNRVQFVLQALVSAGAQPEILYKQKPHVGTDVLKTVVKNIRNEIIRMGGIIHFNKEVTNLLLDTDGQVKGLEVEGGEVFYSKHIVAATGHSSRDFYKLLYDKGISMNAKPFAVGVRIEHPQSLINVSQYGKDYNSERLGAADYKLSCQTHSGRSVYSFCMCPGGVVVASASEKERLVVNGMSYSKRDLNNANSALLVAVEPSDFDSDHPLAGIEFQRKMEETAYQLGGGEYKAPVETVGDFLGNNKSLKNPYKSIADFNYEKAFHDFNPTYKPNVKNTSLKKVLPEFVWKAIEEALPVFGRKIKGYDDPRAIMTGSETRSSAPVRINRDTESLESISLKGFYPCGEGAGYAGGITSAAVDGVKVAEKIIMELINK